MADDVSQKALSDAFRALLSDAAGQRVLFWILEQSSMYADAFTGDPHSTNYMLGQQSVGRRMIAQMDAIDPQFYPQLLIDHAEIRSRDAAASEALNPENDDDD